MKYTPEVLKLLGDAFNGSEAARGELTDRGHKELLLLLAYIIDGKDEAFELLMKQKHFILAAFLKAVDKERKSIKFLLDMKAPEWVAVASHLNSDPKAKGWLLKSGFNHHAELAEAIMKRLQKENEDSGFNAIMNPLR